MPTLNQLIRHGREEKRRTDRTRAIMSFLYRTKESKHIMTIIDRKTNGQFPGRKKRETNGIRPMRTDMSVVSQSDMYESANMSNKGLRMSNFLVRISTVVLLVFLLLTLSYSLSLLLGLEYHPLLVKIQSMLVGRGIRSIFNSLGWPFLGLFLCILSSCFDSEREMMDPESASGAAAPSEPSINQGDNPARHRNDAGPSNPNRPEPSAIPGENSSEHDSKKGDQPSPPRIPYISLLYQEGERGELLRELHDLVAFQFQRHCEIGLPRSRQSNSTQPFAAEAALFILGFDLEISPNMESAELREWIETIKNSPDDMRGIYNMYKPK